MTQRLTPVTRDQLVVGKRYADNDELDKYTTILEYVSSDHGGNSYFININGTGGYLATEDGLTGFAGTDPFYELPTDHPDYR